MSIDVTPGTGKRVSATVIGGEEFQNIIQHRINGESVANKSVRPRNLAVNNAAASYLADQLVGGKITIANAAAVNGGSGLIQSALVSVAANLSVPYDVIFFDTDPTSTTFTNNAAFNVATADLPSICGVARCNDQVSLGTNQLFQANNLSFPFKITAADTNLYAAVVIRGAQSFASTNLVKFAPGILQD